MGPKSRKKARDHGAPSPDELDLMILERRAIIQALFNDLQNNLSVTDDDVFGMSGTLYSVLVYSWSVQCGKCCFEISLIFSSYFVTVHPLQPGYSG